jgi:hypothetical protein
VLHAQVLSQRTHDLFQGLADQNDVCTGIHKLANLFCTLRFQLRFQLVLKEFLAQKIKTIAADPPEHGVHHAGGKLAVCGIENRTQQRHQKNQPAPPNSLRKCLRIPGKEGHRPYDRQIKQAALYPPVDGGRRTGIVVLWFQSMSTDCRPELRTNAALIVNNWATRTKRKELYESFRASPC